MDIKDILLDMHHQLITVDEAEIKLRALAMEEIKKLYLQHHVPDDVPEECLAFNGGVDACAQLFCKHEALEENNANNGRIYQHCSICGYTKDVGCHARYGIDDIF